MANFSKNLTYYFNRFEVTLPLQCVIDCSHQGKCDDDVKFWLKKLNLVIFPDDLRKELKEYGAWDEIELSDHESNLNRILWITACNLKEDYSYLEELK